MLKVSGLAAHADCRFEIERQLVGTALRTSPATTTFGLRFNETVEPRSVFKLRVGVEQERCVIRVGYSKRVQFLQIRDKVVNTLCI